MSSYAFSCPEQSEKLVVTRNGLRDPCSTVVLCELEDKHKNNSANSSIRHCTLRVDRRCGTDDFVMLDRVACVEVKSDELRKSAENQCIPPL